MAGKTVCPHIVTVFNQISNGSRSAQYQATVLYHVHIHHQEGQISNDAADDALRVHIFDDCVIPADDRTFVGYQAFEAMDEAERLQHWTLSPDGTDYIAEGESETDSEGCLPDDVTLYRIKKIGRREMGTKRMWHWKVECL
ncbi:MAG: hypothetical protein J6A79_07830 [Clostridia bacterium]|nr:hypothetical protein [Clostridia bacterium]